MVEWVSIFIYKYHPINGTSETNTSLRMCALHISMHIHILARFMYTHLLTLMSVCVGLCRFAALSLLLSPFVSIFRLRACVCVCVYRYYIRLVSIPTKTSLSTYVQTFALVFTYTYELHSYVVADLKFFALSHLFCSVSIYIHVLSEREYLVQNT